MPKRAFGEFYSGSTFANIGFQAPFQKTHVSGEHTFRGSDRPASWTPTGSAAQSPASSTGMPPRRRKVMMRATVSRPVTHRVRGARITAVSGRRMITRPQGVGPRTGGFTGIERKFYDTSLISGALTAPTDSTGGEHDESATICMNTIIQGDGESERDGRKATIQSAFVKGVIKCVKVANATVTVDATKVYVAMVLDTQTNGAQLASELVFKNDSANANLAASPMRNMQYTQRFRILDTFEAVLADPNISWDGTNMEQQGILLPFQLSSNLTFSTQYSASTETVANITDNSLHIIAFCSNTGLVPTINYNARVRFVG